MTFSIQTALATMIDQLEHEMNEVGFEVTEVSLGEDLYEAFWKEGDETGIGAYVVQEWMLQPDEWTLGYKIHAETGVFNLNDLKDVYARRNVVSMFG